MALPSAYEKLVQNWEKRAQELEDMRFADEAARIRMMARELRRAEMEDQDELFTLDEAVAYSRGYDKGYLRRTLENYGTRMAPLFRKGDVPRHPLRARREEAA